jgi:hypothetical protein
LRASRNLAGLLVGLVGFASQRPASGQEPSRLEALKTEVSRSVDGQKALVEQIVDQLFSYGELGFQEVESSRYLADLLRRHGFTVTTGVAGIPTAWVARWGKGRHRARRRSPRRPGRHRASISRMRHHVGASRRMSEPRADGVSQAVAHRGQLHRPTVL